MRREAVMEEIKIRNMSKIVYGKHNTVRLLARKIVSEKPAGLKRIFVFGSVLTDNDSPDSIISLYLEGVKHQSSSLTSALFDYETSSKYEILTEEELKGNSLKELNKYSTVIYDSSW